uniref:MYND-type domain-containing protein n=1 Tax=Macrostomum lignano TaxID=282301 RepID=A0A1I8F3M1_9PLAT
ASAKEAEKLVDAAEPPVPQRQPCSQCGRHGDWQRCARCRNKRYCSRACQQQHWPRHKQLCGELAAQLSWADFMQRLGQRLQISRLMDLPDSPMRQLMPDHVLAPFQYPCWPWLLFWQLPVALIFTPALSLAPVPGIPIPVFMYSSLDEPPELLSTNRPGMSESLLALGRPVPASLSELVERPAAVLRDSASLLGPDLSQGEPVAWFGLFLRVNSAAAKSTFDTYRIRIF